MSKVLLGEITIDRRLLEHPVWDRDPACYGKAWVDLLCLANDAPRAPFIHGEAICLTRGQLTWSQRALEIRWKRSDLWVRSFLKFCVDQTMILVDANRRRTIITILNYDVYNSPVTRTGSDTDLDSESRTGSDTDLEQKGESGIGIRKGEEKPPRNQGFVEVPSEAEVLMFAQGYPGDIARGIPAIIRPGWATDWFRYKVGAGTLEKKWREKMASDWGRDFVTGHPKARGPVVSPSGRTPAQARFEIARELEEVQARLDAAHETGTEPKASDKRREKELREQIKALTADPRR